MVGIPTAKFVARARKGDLLVRIHVEVGDHTKFPLLETLTALVRRLFELRHLVTAIVLIFRIPPALHFLVNFD